MGPPFPAAAAPDEATEALRVPPHSIQAEQAVLGGLMLANDSWDPVSERVGEGDFYRQEHRLIFRALAELAQQGSPFDAVTVHERLAKTGELDSAGGAAYLGTLSQSTPSAANIAAYADIVRERSVLRQLISVGTDIATSGYVTEGRPMSELLDDAERKVFEIAEQTARSSRGGARGMKEVLKNVVEKIDELFNSDSHITGVTSGFNDFDEKTAGLQPADLVIVAGRPSMGKTTFAMNLAENAAMKAGKSVAVFSMEMPAESLVMRMLSSLGRIDQHRLRVGDLTDEDWPRITSTVQILSEARIFIDDTPGLSPTEMRSRSRRIAREHGLDMIVVDYLQLMQVPGMKENRTAEISEISRGLKGLAKELNVPVIALSQLNRSLEQRPNKRPVMSDLRESGAIEQDADVIIFIYRDEVYNPDTPDKGKAEIIIGKQRNGPIGTVNLTFLGKHTRFENYIPEVYGGEEYQ